MGREELFSKLNIKDYNNKLEKIIEKKAFSEDTKNLLLNMLYKIEVAYDDYDKVKVETRLKKDILEEILNIVEKDCNSIELIKPKIEKDEVLKDKKSIGIKSEKKIVTYPNEKAAMSALYSIKEKSFEANDNYTIIKNSLGYLFHIGNNIDITEIIRDFDGWSWNINVEDIENININLVYQIIQMLLGNLFIQTWEANGERNDSIKLLELEFTRKYGKELGKGIYKLTCQIGILIYIEKHQEERNKIIEEQKALKKELVRMENKKGYLQELANKKKEIGKKVKNIDSIVNNTELLKEEFIKNNETVEENKQIFSLSDFSDFQQNERNRLMKELKEYGKLMEPMIYVETKNEIKEKVNILGELKLEQTNEGEIDALIMLLQKMFLKAFEVNIKEATTKKDIEELIYKIRYYKFIPIGNNKFVKDIEELEKEISKVEKILITKACKLKVINILSNGIELNFRLISNLLNTKIIDLNETVFEFKKKNDKTILNIYEENIIDFTKEYDYIEDLNVKYNKKIKLFI